MRDCNFYSIETLLQLIVDLSIQTNKLLSVLAIQSEYYSEATNKLIEESEKCATHALNVSTKLLKMNMKDGDSA